MNDNLKAKAKNLPPEVYAYLDSFKADELNVLIANKYKFNLPQLRIYYDLIAQLFLKEIPATNLVETIKNFFGFSDLVARQLACDIAGTRLLVVADWLGVDISGLISSWGGDSAKYQSYAEIQQRAIPLEAEWVAQQLAEPPEFVDEPEDDEDVDWEEREKKIKEFFANNLVEMLSSNDNEVLSEINDFIFHLIFNVREEIQGELANLLLNNQETLTSQRLVLDGRQVDPTVANWLSYFITQKGSGMFDAVALSDFVTNSPNAKFLDFDEKKLLSNLLQVYCNLKFFPENLPSSDPRHWMIFPVAIPEEPLGRNVGAQETNSTRFAPVIPVTKPKIFPKTTAVNHQEEAQAKLKAQQITETQTLLARYPEGSLERLALEEELDKLKR